MIANTNRMQYEKIYVGMYLYVSAEGMTKPVMLEWENGERFSITKVIDKKAAPPRHVGSTPTVRYTVLIQGRERELYYEKFYNKWFVEKML